MIHKLLVQPRNISRAEEWETFMFNLTVTLWSLVNGRKLFKEMEAKWGPYVVTVSKFVIGVIQFSRDLFSSRNVIFDLLYKEERLDSSWSTLKPLRFLLLGF